MFVSLLLDTLGVLNLAVADLYGHIVVFVRDVIYDIGRVELRDAIPTTVTINYDLTGKLEYELASTTYFLRDTTYTDKVSYQIDVVQTEYDDFIAFLNKNTVVISNCMKRT